MAKLKETLKDMMNTRADEKTGTYYVKGKEKHMGHRPSQLFGKEDFEYSSDPELNRGYKEHR